MVVLLLHHRGVSRAPQAAQACPQPQASCPLREKGPFACLVLSGASVHTEFNSLSAAEGLNISGKNGKCPHLK